jgi:hypothetical protein
VAPSLGPIRVICKVTRTWGVLIPSFFPNRELGMKSKVRRNTVQHDAPPPKKKRGEEGTKLGCLTYTGPHRSFTPSFGFALPEPSLLLLIVFIIISKFCLNKNSWKILWTDTQFLSIHSCTQIGDETLGIKRWLQGQTRARRQGDFKDNVIYKRIFIYQKINCGHIKGIWSSKIYLRCRRYICSPIFICSHVPMEIFHYWRTYLFWNLPYN